MLESNAVHFMFPPFEGGGLGIVDRQKAIDSFSDLAWRGEAGTAQSLPRQNAEPDFDLIEPASVGRCSAHGRSGGVPASDPASAYDCSGYPRESPDEDNRPPPRS
jgi:hypothetical protein